MLIPHLHFCGNAQEAIALYEKAFNTRAKTIIRNSEYAPVDCNGDNHIAHAVMQILRTLQSETFSVIYYRESEEDMIHFTCAESE